VARSPLCAATLSQDVIKSVRQLRISESERPWTTLINGLCVGLPLSVHSHEDESSFFIVFVFDGGNATNPHWARVVG
jgi:hypothetical protein